MVMPGGVVPETVVVITGPFEGAGVERWGNLIAEAVAIGPERLIVDLAGSPTMDAGAIVVLLGAHRTMMRIGGHLTLRNPNGRVRRVLKLARVDQVFDIVGQPATA
jgi:anti-anti-sigma factor